MAGTFKKFINAMSLSDDNDDDYKEFEPSEEFDNLDYSDGPSVPVKNNILRKPASSKTYDPTLDIDDDEEDYAPKKTFRPARKQANNVVAMKRSQSEVVMFRPATFFDAKEIVDTLLLGRAVVMNLEGVNLDVAQRITDFAAGASYAMQGDIQSISKFIFIVAPSNIDLSGDFAGSIGGGSDSLNINI